MNTNKTVIREVALTSVTLEAAIKSGVVLSVLIAPTSVKLFCTMAIVQYPALPEAAAKACAHNLRRAGVPFAAADKALNPTMATIPPAHLAGQQVVEKVYGPAQPATRPVVKPAGAPAPAPAEEPVKLAPTAEGNLAPAPKKAKKARAPRAKKAKNTGESAAEQAVG